MECEVMCDDLDRAASVIYSRHWSAPNNNINNVIRDEHNWIPSHKQTASRYIASRTHWLIRQKYTHTQHTFKAPYLEVVVYILVQIDSISSVVDVFCGLIEQLHQYESSGMVEALKCGSINLNFCNK